LLLHGLHVTDGEEILYSGREAVAGTFVFHLHHVGADILNLLEYVLLSRQADSDHKDQ
jgi:hypothetical protein